MKAAVNTRNESPDARRMRGISKPQGRRDLGQGACHNGCAKRFAPEIEFALAPDGPWTDAKMHVKASQGATLHFRIAGPDGKAMLAAVHDGFR